MNEIFQNEIELFDDDCSDLQLKKIYIKTTNYVTELTIIVLKNQNIELPINNKHMYQIIIKLMKIIKLIIKKKKKGKIKKKIVKKIIDNLITEKIIYEQNFKLIDVIINRISKDKILKKHVNICKNNNIQNELCNGLINLIIKQSGQIIIIKSIITFAMLIGIKPNVILIFSNVIQIAINFI